MSKDWTVDNPGSSQAEENMLKYIIFITSTNERLGVVALEKKAGWCVVLFTPLKCVHTH